MGECFGQKPGTAQPPRGPPVQFRFQAGHALAQVGPEDLPEERMEPVPGVSEPLDERVLAVQPGKDGFGVGPQGQRVGQLGAETLQHADAQQ